MYRVFETKVLRAAPVATCIAVLFACGEVFAQGGANGAADDFAALHAQWNEKTELLYTLQEEYPTSGRSRQQEIERTFDRALAQRDALAGPLEAAALKKFTDAPRTSQAAEEVLVIMLGAKVGEDRMEEAYALAKLLLENGAGDPRIYDAAGISAFCTNHYEEAKAYLEQAKAKNAITPPGSMYLDLTPWYTRLWKEEKRMRAAEAEADDLPRVKISTTEGDIVVELFENEAPNTVANFISLVEKGFYDGLDFHRVLPGFMAQGGCPRGTGVGGPGYQIPCECYRQDHRKHFRGSLSMAHAGRDTGGSQYFLTFVPTEHLNGKHTVFGRMIQGFDVLGKLERIEPGMPGEPDKMIKVEILRKRNHSYVPRRSQ